MEEKIQAAEALLVQSRGPDALDNAIKTAELYMQAALRASSKTEGLRLRRRCQELIAYAEKLKSETDLGSAVEDVILSEASILNGHHFPRWRSDPSKSDFQTLGGVLFRDNVSFTLSPAQLETFGGWKRPTELFEKTLVSTNERPALLADDLDSRFFATGSGPCDLVQDVTTDCSVVAGLSAAIRVLTGKRSMLANIFHPFNNDQNRPKHSASGKYIMRLNFNGCFRKVVIDDKLPDSLTERTLFVIDRLNRQLLWPALLEKAYLKVRGGYDFPGSNSGTDLWVMTGWIPEQIFLQREDIDIREVWSRVKNDYDLENVVITIGTGVTSPEEEVATGLVGEHDYAVQGLFEKQGMCWLLVKNPWCIGPAWTGGWQSTASVSLSKSSSAMGAEPPRDRQSSGAIWVSLEDVAQNFESMYLNWNPDLFAHRTDRHFAWTMSSAYLASTLVSNPQFSLVAPRGGVVWILFSRHFQDAELKLLKNRTSSDGTMAAAARQLGFITIKVFDSGGRRVQISGSETYRGPYVDSPQTLARLNTTAGKAYTVVLDQQELPLKNYTFSMSTFSQGLVEVEDAVEAFAHIKSEEGSWNRRSAGGSAACSTYFLNPQFRVEIPGPTNLTILLFTEKGNIHIHVDLLWGHGERVTVVKDRDIVASSGEYSRACAIAEASHVDAGVYTLVCSTFEAGQQASFGLRLTSEVPVALVPIPADAAGRLRTLLPPCVLQDGVDGMRIPINAGWLARASAAVHTSSPQAGANRGLLLRLSIVLGWGPNRVVVAESGGGGYLGPTVALRTPEFDIEPGRVQMSGMWLVAEGIGPVSEGHVFETEIFSDSPVHIGAWESF